MRKLLLVSFALFGIILISGCSNGVKTTNDLKKELAPAKSEYEKCIAEVQDYQEKFDKEMSDCKKMPDGINCVGCGGGLQEDGNYPADHQECNVCKDTQRYNDEIAKSNECGEKIKWDSTQLSITDCLELLNK